MFSVIVCSHRPERATFVREHYARLFPAHEFILIDDAKSLCEGYNRGIAQSHGDLLIFSHDDIEFAATDVATRVEKHLSMFDVIGIGGTTRLINGSWYDSGDPFVFMLVVQSAGKEFEVHLAGAGPLVVPGIQAIDGCFMACRRQVALDIGFDAARFDGFHLYDLDFSFGACLAGYSVAVCRDLPLIHYSRGEVDRNVWNVYGQRFEEKYRGWLSDGQRGRRPARYVLKTDRATLEFACRPESIEQALSSLGTM